MDDNAVVIMVLQVKASAGLSTSAIARGTGIARPHLSAFLNGRGHVGRAKIGRLRRWCLKKLVHVKDF
jgi:transcriptional regulator with XRE-family HTH domain